MSISIDPRPLELAGNPDQVFAGQGFPRPFEFNKAVVDVFDDMVSRSVPLYREVIDSLVYWVAMHCPERGRIYDLGCSTGTTIAAIGRSLARPLKFEAVDSSAEMLTKAREKLTDFTPHQVHYHCQNLQDTSFERADVVIMNYTLQFLPIKDRLMVLRRIRAALQPGGFLYLSEKVRSENLLVQETTTRIYEDFKRRRGYSQDEISRKKEALDNVLIPLSEKQQIDMLREAGFTSCEVITKWNNFTTFVVM